MATIEELSRTFQLRRAEIDFLDQALAIERRAIQIAAFDEGRDLTDAEKKRRKEIGSTRQELAEALQVIALTSLQGLNSAEDVEVLNKDIARISDNLKDDLQRLVDIVDHAKAAAKVASGLATVVKKAAELVV